MKTMELNFEHLRDTVQMSSTTSLRRLVQSINRAVVGGRTHSQFPVISKLSELLEQVET